MSLLPISVGGSTTSSSEATGQFGGPSPHLPPGHPWDLRKNDERLLGPLYALNYESPAC